MNRSEWQDAKIDKPKSIDPVLVHTSDGFDYVAQWDGYTWFDANTKEDLVRVEKFFDYLLPTGAKISDFYYQDRPEEEVPTGFTKMISRIYGGR